jgi:hypothetical protein
VRSFLDFKQKLVVCEVSKQWNEPMRVKVWRTGYGMNRLWYSLPPLGSRSGILREPATERQRLLQAVVKIQRCWMNRALAPVLHFDPNMCRGGYLQAKPKHHLLALHFGYLRRSTRFEVEDCGFNKLGLRMLVSSCIDEYFNDAWRDDDTDDEDADPVCQFWINEVEETCPSGADGAVLDKPTLQRFLLHRLWACVNQPNGYARPAGYMTYGRIRCGCSPDGGTITREDVEISLRQRGRRITYSKMLGMGTKRSGLSARHRPGGSRRGQLFYAGHGGWLYAPISYHYATGEFALDRRLQDYDSATDSFDLLIGSAAWSYSYLNPHDLEVHLKSGSWVPRAAHGWGWGYDQDVPTRSAKLAPYVSLK